MNVKRLFWKIWFGNRRWANGVWFGFPRCQDQIDGWLYFGVTLFGVSLVYSDRW